MCLPVGGKPPDVASLPVLRLQTHPAAHSKPALFIIVSCSCCAVLPLPGDPDAADVSREGGGHTEAEPAGSGAETRGGAAESGRAGGPPHQEGAPHRGAEEVPRGCKMPSEVSVDPCGSLDLQDILYKV